MRLPICTAEDGAGEGCFNFFSIIMKHKETWRIVYNIIISILTALATTLGLTSCL